MLEGIEKKKKSIINRKDKYKNACYIMSCLGEKLWEHIKVRDADEKRIDADEKKINALKSII